MRFAHPYWLLAAIPALLAGWASYRWLEPNRLTLPFPTAKSLGAPAGGRAAVLPKIPYVLKTAALLLAAIAMARPQLVDEQIRSATRGVDILLTIDTSISMRAIDISPGDRITAAKEAAAQFVQRRKDDRIGVVVFAGAPILGCPLTLDYAAVVEYLGDVSAGMTNTDGTAIGDAIVSAVNHLKGSKSKSKVAVLLTDGSSNTGLIDPVTAAKTAATFGIKLHTIGVGKRGQAFIPVDTPFGRQLAPIPDDLREDVLTEVATMTGGRYFRATNQNELKEIYDEIDRLEKTEVGKPTVISYHDLFAWLLVPAALLLLAEMSVSRTMLLRVP